MINTLIVDDESLVRRGLVFTVPWEKFNIHVIGEAGNGKTALEFMQHHVVDLLIADLTMPVMDGFELMKAVRTLYPGTSIVVLTCHQDFDFIQEAMRIGAIDYIVKTQLEDDSIENAIERIVDRIRADDSARDRSARKQAATQKGVSCGTILVDIAKKGDMKNALAEQFDEMMWIDAGEGAVYIPSRNDIGEQPIHRFAIHSEGIVIIEIHHSHPASLSSITKHLRNFTEKFMFYEYEPANSFYEISFSLLEQSAGGLTKQQLHNVEDWWFKADWLADEVKFAEFQTELQQLRLSGELLSEMMCRFIIRWNRIVKSEQFRQYINLLAGLKQWRDFVSLLTAVRGHIATHLRNSPYSCEIFGSIVQSVDYMHQFDQAGLSRDQLAVKFYMSSGYFSQCFKEIVGTSYGEYMKSLQLNKSMELLRDTSHPVYWIAERIGYKDEKYFSKMFRDYTGMNPVQYRKKIRGGEG